MAEIANKMTMTEMSEFFKETNHFERQKSIPSTLIHGNPDQVKRPFITIAIPTYQRENVIRHALESALNQIHPDCEYEILIVDNDDCCQGESETEKIIKEYSDDRLLYYRNQQNLGMAGNWNRCAELARGQWVAFLHDDDLLKHDYIHTIVKLINKRMDAGAILSDYTVIYEKNDPGNARELKRMGMPDRLTEKLGKTKLMKLNAYEAVVLGYNIYGAPTCGNIFRRASLLESGGFDQRFFPSFDWFFYYKFNQTYPVYKSITSFGYYRFFENVSLNPETLKKFVADAIEFRKHALESQASGSLFVKLFQVEMHVRTVHGIVNLSTFSGNNLDHKSFDHLCPYTIRPVRFFIYTAIRESYWRLKKAAALIMS